MVDQETQDKLDKLKRLEDKARERSKAWMDKIKADGKKQISAILTAKAFNEICLRRDKSTLTGKPLTTGDVIEQALFPDINTNVNSDTVLLKKKETTEPILETQSEIPRPMPEQDINLPDYLIDVNPNITIEERDKIVLRMKEDFPKGKGVAQKRIEMLNAAGILLDGKPWEDTKQFSDQLTCARRRAKKKS